MTTFLITFLYLRNCDTSKEFYYFYTTTYSNIDYIHIEMAIMYFLSTTYTYSPKIPTHPFMLLFNIMLIYRYFDKSSKSSDIIFCSWTKKSFSYCKSLIYWSYSFLIWIFFYCSESIFTYYFISDSIVSIALVESMIFWSHFLIFWIIWWF